MKILIFTGNDSCYTEYVLGYFESTTPEIMTDIVVVDVEPSEERKKMVGAFGDLTYIYFEEYVTPGSALNQVISGLEIDEDIVIMDSKHIPMLEAVERLNAALSEMPEAFAVGPVSNSFSGWQKANWVNADEALDWSIGQKDKNYEESLYLYSGVIAFKKSVLKSKPIFNEEIMDMGNLILEKCMREFIGHKRMYICRNSGFWDVSGSSFEDILIVDEKVFERLYGMHYINVSGNLSLVEKLLKFSDPDKEINVLEIGCDCGGTLFEVKRVFRKAKLYGTDINKNALRFASEFANVIHDNIEDEKLDFGVKFDYVIFGDVLEHLRNPLAALVYCKKLLKTNGRIVASIPNLMNIAVIKGLLDGNFTYQDTGLLDKTHIHMFTYNEIIRMFEGEAGYKIEDMSMYEDAPKDYDHLIDELMKLGNAEKFMYQAYQYQIVARL